MPIFRSPKPFVLISTSIFEDWFCILNQNQFKVLLYIYYLCEKSNDKEVSISIIDLSKLMGCSVFTVSRSLNKLTKLDLVIKEKRKSTGYYGGNLDNKYKINYELLGVINE